MRTSTLLVLAMLASATGQVPFPYTCQPNVFQQTKLVLFSKKTKPTSQWSTLRLREHCSALRSDMDYIIWYSTICMQANDRTQNDDVLRAGRDHIRDVCEDGGIDDGWEDSRCYRVGGQMAECENNYEDQVEKSKKTYMTMEEKCRMFLGLRMCTERRVSHCSPGDEKYINFYLIRKAGRLVWLCSNITRNEFSARALVAMDTSPRKACMSRVTKEYERCMDKYNRRQKDLDTNAISDEARRARICCSFADFSDCVQTAVVDLDCQQQTDTFVRELLKDENPLGTGCSEYYHGSPKCPDSATGLQSLGILVVLCLVSLLLW